MKVGNVMKKLVLRKKKVIFQVRAKPGSEVFVAGSFNNWNASQNPMRDNPHSGVFKVALTLPPGRHEYKFVIDGEWCVDPDCAESVSNGHGSLNSVISI